MSIKKPTTFKNMFRQFSINSSKYVHFWTQVLKTILILIKFPFQRYISCRHLNYDPTYEDGRHSDFLPFWKLGTLVLVDHFVVCTKIFLDVIGLYKNVKEEFSLDSNIFMRRYSMSVTGLLVLVLPLFSCEAFGYSVMIVLNSSHFLKI